jgi:hypothetical protein
VAAKASVDIQDVSYARLFACAVALICACTCTKFNIVICEPMSIFSLSYQLSGKFISLGLCVVVIILVGHFEMFVILLLVIESMV